MSSSDNTVHLSRDVEAVKIPSGEKITLPAKTMVIVTQSLGGSYTVLIPTQAGLFRIQGRDADSLGKPIPAEQSPAAATSGPVDEKKIWERLKTCYDPEIPVNIVDLGLIYSLETKPDAKGGTRVEVKMTLTAQGCGMGPSIAEDARQKILTVPGVAAAQVEVVWDPPWTPELISPEGRQKLGMA